MAERNTDSGKVGAPSPTEVRIDRNFRQAKSCHDVVMIFTHQGKEVGVAVLQAGAVSLMRGVRHGFSSILSRHLAWLSLALTRSYDDDDYDDLSLQSFSPQEERLFVCLLLRSYNQLNLSLSDFKCIKILKILFQNSE